MKSNPLEKMKKRSPRTQFFWCYTLGFLLCAAGCYCWFLIKGKTLIVDSDGWRQHFAAFVYLGQYGREVARTLLTTHKLVLPQLDFSIGLGSDAHHPALLRHRRSAGSAQRGVPHPLCGVSLQLFIPAATVSGRAGLRCFLLCKKAAPGRRRDRRCAGVCVHPVQPVHRLSPSVLCLAHGVSCPCCCWVWSRSWQASGRICLSSLFFWPPSAIFTFSICWRSSRRFTRCIS